MPYSSSNARRIASELTPCWTTTLGVARQGTILDYHVMDEHHSVLSHAYPIIVSNRRHAPPYAPPGSMPDDVRWMLPIGVRGKECLRFGERLSWSTVLAGLALWAGVAFLALRALDALRDAEVEHVG